MFGVVVCPSCATAQGVDLSMARVTCVRCGNKIDLKLAKLFFSSDSQREVAEAVRQFGQQSRQNIEDWDGAVSKPSPSPKVVRVKEDETGLRALAEKLTGTGDEFGREDLARELDCADKDRLQGVVDKMLSSGIMYEVSAGRYRSTDTRARRPPRH
jgi:hypothetical protein